MIAFYYLVFGVNFLVAALLLIPAVKLVFDATVADDFRERLTLGGFAVVLLLFCAGAFYISGAAHNKAEALEAVSCKEEGGRYFNGECYPPWLTITQLFLTSDTTELESLLQWKRITKRE